MNKAVPWSVKGVDFDARTAAKEAARRAGMTLGEWLNSVIAEQAAEQGIDPEDIGEAERVAVVRSRLERMSPGADRPAAPGLRRRSDRPAARLPEIEEEDDAPFERPRPRRYRETLAPRESFYEGRAEALLEDAARSFERHARRGSAETNAALESVARRLEGIESRLEGPRAEPSQDRALKRVISRLESRIEALAAREDGLPAPEASRHFPPPHHPVAPAYPAQHFGGRATPDAIPEVRMSGHPQEAPSPYAPPVQGVQFGSVAAMPAAAPAAGPMRSSDLARIEAKLNRLLDREQQPPLPLYPEGGTAAYTAYRPDFAAPPQRRSMQDAIADINRRQADLDRTAPKGARTSVFQRMAAPDTAPAENQGELRQTVSTLKGEIAELTRHIEMLRREGQRPEGVSPARDTASAQAPLPEIDSLKGEVASLTRHIESLRSEAQKPDTIAATLREALSAAQTKTPEIDGLKGEIAKLTRHIETLRREVQKPDVIAASIREAVASHAHEAGPELDELRQQLSEMSAAIGRLAPRENLASLENAVRKLGEQMSQPRFDGARENLLAPVEQLVSDLRDKIEDFAPRASVESIRREIEMIRESIEANASGGIDHEAFERACAQTAEIRNLLAAAVARPVPIENIEKQISALAKRVDIIAARGMTPVGVSAVNESVGEIRAAMESVAPSHLLVTIEERIEELGRKIDEATSRPSPAAEQLESISQRLDSVQKTLAAQAKRQAAAEKASPGGTDTAGSQHFGEIAERLASVQQTLAWQAERQPMAKVDTTLLEGMLQQIMDKVSRPALEPSLPHLDNVERSLKDIAARVEALASQTDGEGIAGLEERITSLAIKLDRPEFSGPSLGDIEQTLAHLASQLEENRLSAIDAASNAARSAARDVLAEFSDVSSGTPASLDSARELIAREINGLRALQDAADRRTHATLGAVHETLEKVVDRLAMLEDEVGDREPAKAAPVATKAAPADDYLASGPAPVFSRPDSARAPTAATPVALAPQTPVPTFEQVREAERRTQTSLQVAADESEPAIPRKAPAPGSAPAISAPLGMGDDFLIEPGSGKRPQRGGAAPVQPDTAITPPPASEAHSAEQPVHGRASASNFIAAARRAQQAAQMQAEIEAAQQPVGKKGVKPPVAESALAEARNRAQAAASVLSISLKRGKKDQARESETEGQDAASAELIDPPRRKGLFSSRKVLYSLAGLVLVLGALTIIRQNMMRNTPPPRPVAAAPTSSAPAPAPRAPQASPISPELGQPGATLLTPPPAKAPDAQPPQAQIPTDQPAADRSPVSTIPTFVGGAPTGAAASGNNLRVAAASGDPRAQYELAIRMIEGRTETRDPAAAVPLLEKASQRGLAPAQYRLGALYEKGIGVEKSLPQARHWYEQAASAGNVKAMHNFAVLLAEGGEGKPDYATAANWFKRAAEFGVRDSQYNLAILYARGLGVEQSLVEAYVWMALAEGQGDTDAANKRNDIAKRLSPGQLTQAQERVQRFRPQRAQSTANEVAQPPGGWTNGPASAQVPATEPAPAQPAPNSRGPAPKRPKVSSL
jgi:localization factor PodJL